MCKQWKLLMVDDGDTVTVSILLRSDPPILRRQPIRTGLTEQKSLQHVSRVARASTHLQAVSCGRLSKYCHVRHPISQKKTQCLATHVIMQIRLLSRDFGYLSDGPRDCVVKTIKPEPRGSWYDLQLIHSPPSFTDSVVNFICIPANSFPIETRP
jgi:hypothetical protein